MDFEEFFRLDKKKTFLGIIFSLILIYSFPNSPLMEISWEDYNCQVFGSECTTYKGLPFTYESTTTYPSNNQHINNQLEPRFMPNMFFADSIIWIIILVITGFLFSCLVAYFAAVI